ALSLLVMAARVAQRAPSGPPPDLEEASAETPPAEHPTEAGAAHDVSAGTPPTGKPPRAHAIACGVKAEGTENASGDPPRSTEGEATENLSAEAPRPVMCPVDPQEIENVS